MGTRFVRSWRQSFLLDSNRCHQYSNERSRDFCLVCLQGHGLAQSYIQAPIFEKVEHTFWLICMTFFKECNSNPTNPKQFEIQFENKSLRLDTKTITMRLIY